MIRIEVQEYFTIFLSAKQMIVLMMLKVSMSQKTGNPVRVARLRFRSYAKQARKEFKEITETFAHNESVLRLDENKQHFKYTGLRHSLDVAWYSFLIAKLLGWDAPGAARSGILHDLFFLSEGQKAHALLFSHPQIALQNAKEICRLSPIEENTILRHM